MMLQQDVPDNFVLGTGESHTEREFAEAAFREIDIELEWKGSRLNEIEVSDRRTYVKVGKEFYRPLESDNCMADYSKARDELGWIPKTSFNELVKIKVRNDIRLLED